VINHSYTERKISKYCEANIIHEMFFDIYIIIIVINKFDCDDEIYISVKYILLIVKNKID